MAHHSGSTDGELLAATAAGDSAAFAVFYRRQERVVLAWLRARVGDPELAADLAAEAFATVLEAADRFDPRRAGGSSAAGWLFAITHNTLMSALRRGRVAEDARRRLQMQQRLVLADHDIERIVALGDMEHEVRRLLDGLPDKQRKAIIARVLDERDYEEIAAELRCSPLVVRKRVSRGLATLRGELKGMT